MPSVLGGALLGGALIAAAIRAQTAKSRLDRNTKGAGAGFGAGLALGLGAGAAGMYALKKAHARPGPPLVKAAAKQERDSVPSYSTLLLAAAPAFALKSIAGDMSKASTEHGVEQKVLGTRGSFAKHLLAGAKGRGTGRMLGGMLGVATAPMFIRGTQLLQSDDKKDKAKGMALVGASTAAFAGAKGFLEAGLGAHTMGLSPAASAAKGAVLGLTRSTYKLPLALITAASVAAGRKKSEKKDGNPWSKYLVPMAVGAGAGALSRGIEDAVATRVAGKKLTSSSSLRKLRAAMAGGAAGGVLGGLVLSAAVEGTNRMLNRGKEKKSSLQMRKTAVAWDALASILGEGAKAVPGIVGRGIYEGGVKHGLPAAIGQHWLTSSAFGFKSNKANPLDLLLRKLPFGAHKYLTRVANTARSRQFALGLKEGLQGKYTQNLGSTVVHSFSIPELGVSRGMGLEIGRKLRDIPEHEREAALKQLQHRLASYPGIDRTKDGAFNPIIGPALGGISMALGERPMYRGGGPTPTFKKWWAVANLKGTGLDKPGLPRGADIGELQKTPGYLRRNLPHMATLAVTLPIAPMGGPIGALGGHGMFSSIKNLIADAPPVAKYIKQTTANDAIHHGLFPNIKKTTGEHIGTSTLETLLGPATVTMEHGMPSITTAIRDEKLKELLERSKERVGTAFEKQVGPRKTTLRNDAMPYLAGGLGAAGLAGAGIFAHRHGVFGRANDSKRDKSRK